MNGNATDTSVADGPNQAIRKPVTSNERRTLWAAVLTCGFMFAEVIGGVVSGSLALLADAAHMLTDGAALALAWVGFMLSRRPAGDKRTFGFDRFQILFAFANGLTLLALVAWITYEAVDRFFQPVEVLAGPMLVIAVLGLLVNVGALYLLHGADRKNLNIRGAILHVMGDLLGSVAAIVAAGVILVTGWMPIDPLLSVFVVLLIVRSAVRLVADSAHILIEGAPSSSLASEISEAILREISSVQDVHHIHVWSLTQEKPLVTLHARVRRGMPTAEVAYEIVYLLQEKYGIKHSTVQVEYDKCLDDLDGAV